MWTIKPLRAQGEEVNDDARVFAELERRGIPVLNSQAAAENFIEWFGTNDRLRL